jgi:hypothetical protein
MLTDSPPLGEPLMLWLTPVYNFLTHLHPFFISASCILSLTAALFFLRFYRKTGDRLFFWFAAAFAVMGLNRLAFFIINAYGSDLLQTEPLALFVIRLVAFLLILLGIIDKNRARRRSP